jgi:demethoxyubiquinone hydroxylase (CLK1/Coq7/Cat5 family)
VASNNANSMEKPDLAKRDEQIFIGEIRVNRVGG